MSWNPVKEWLYMSALVCLGLAVVLAIGAFMLPGCETRPVP